MEFVVSAFLKSDETDDVKNAADIKKAGWTPGKQLGNGHFDNVKLVTRDSDGMQAACKIVKKPKDCKKEIVVIDHEIITSIDHPHCVKCYDAYQTDDYLYLFTELMPGGEIFDTLIERGNFTEQDTQKVTYKLLDALKHLHDKGIVHRDLKPEKVLMTSKAPDAECKIADFGLSKLYDVQTTNMKTPCGTPGYIAPEMSRMCGYDHKCDVWSLGVIVYILLCGFPPFYADNDAQLLEMIGKGQYEFPKPYWDPISNEAKDFIRRIFVVDPKQRADIKDLMDDKWLSMEKTEAMAAKLNI